MCDACSRLAAVQQGRTNEKHPDVWNRGVVVRSRCDIFGRITLSPRRAAPPVFTLGHPRRNRLRQCCRPQSCGRCRRSCRLRWRPRGCQREWAGQGDPSTIAIVAVRLARRPRRCGRVGIRVRGDAPHANQTNDRPPGLFRPSIAIRRSSGTAALFCRFPKYLRLLILKPAYLSLKIFPGL
jgi:hypothetical protein